MSARACARSGFSPGSTPTSRAWTNTSGALSARRKESEVMKAIFLPVVLIMLRLPNEKKLPLMLVVFFLPLALLYYETAGQLSTGIKVWVACGVLLGIYVMIAFYIQANEGWTKVLGPFERLTRG